MLKTFLQKTYPLGSLSRSINNISIQEVLDQKITSLAIPLGDEKKCSSSIKKVFNKSLPGIETSTIVSKNKFLFRLSNDLLFLCQSSPKKVPEASIDILKQKFYTTDQSGGWCCLKVSGTRVLEMLERICPLNLSKEKFKVLDVKRTIMEHLGVIIFKNGEKEFWLYSSSSSAKSFLHTVETSCKNI